MSNTEALINKAREFFDRKYGSEGERTDPEVASMLKRLERQLAATRKDQSYKQALVKTLGLLDRDAESRSSDLEQRFVVRAAKRGRNLSGDKLKRLSERALPRELRDMRKQGLDVLEALSNNEKLTGEQLRKFNEQMTAFAAGVEDIRSGKPAFAQEQHGGVTLTERVRQYREGKLADDTRHRELLDKLEATKGKDGDNDKYLDAKKLGLTALFGPAAPMVQLWYDLKEDVQKMGFFTKEQGEEEKRRFSWWRQREEEKEDGEAKQTNLLQRMLKAFRDKASDARKKSKFGLGWLLGDDDDMDLDRGRRRPGRLRRWGRTLGRTAKRGGLAARGALARGGRAVATGARAAWSALPGVGSRLAGAGAGMLGTAAAGASKLGGLAARGLAAINPVAAIGAAGYGGWKIGEAINDHLLTDEQKEWIGKTLHEGVEFVSTSITKAGTAIESATTKVRKFFSNGIDAAGDAINGAVDGIRKGVEAGGEYLGRGYRAAVDGMSTFFETADKRLTSAYDAVSSTVAGLPSLARNLSSGLRTRLMEGLDAGGKWLDDQKTGVASAFTAAKTKLGAFFEDRRAQLASAAASVADFAGDAASSLTAVGKGIKDTVQRNVAAGADALKAAYVTASTRVSQFFDDGVKSATDTMESVRRRVAQEGLDIQKALSEKLVSVTGMFDDWSTKAKEKMEDFWDTLGDKARRGVQSAIQFVREAPAKVAEKARDVARAADAATGGQLRKAANFFGAESKGLGIGRFNDSELASIDAARAQGDKFKGGSGMTAETKALVIESAKRHGQDPEKMLAMVQMESGGNANAVSATGATGLLQFTGGTGKQYGIKNRFDPRENADAGARLMADNVKALKKAGIEPTLENLYLAHQQGSAGAIQIINAAAGKGEISAKVQKNMGLNYGNMTAGQYLEQNKQKIHKAQAVALSRTYEGQYAKTVDDSGNVLTPVAAAPAVAAAGSPARVTATAVTPSTGMAVAAARPGPAGGYERATFQSPVVSAGTTEAPTQQQVPASTGSTNKVGLSDMDFHIGDLGLIVMNRGYVG